MDYHVPDPIARLRLPNRGPNGELSVVAGERELDAAALDAAAQVGGPLLNLTYADTHRFPPASWVLEDFVAAARGGGMTYTPYRGDASVRERVAVSVSAFLGVSVDPDRGLMLTPGTQGGPSSPRLPRPSNQEDGARRRPRLHLRRAHNALLRRTGEARAATLGGSGPQRGTDA